VLKRISYSCYFCCLVCLLASATPVFADVWSAVGDFPTITSSSTKPLNGVWSYGYATTLNPVNFSPDTTATTDYFGDGAAAGFYTPTSTPGTGDYLLPTVLQNLTGSTILTEAGTIGPWPTSLLLLHPGPGDDYSVVQFIAPATATYVVAGEFVAMGNYSGVTNDSASITTSGPSSTTLYSTTSTSNLINSFSFSEEMTAGQSLDFAVGLGPSGQFYYDSTGFNAVISATPEPGFYGLLALGLSGLIAVASRGRRKADKA